MGEESAVAVDGAVDMPRFRDAYQRLSTEIAAVPDDQVVQVNVEIPVAVTTVLGAIPEIRKLRAQLVEELPKFSVERFDKLEAYTLAVAHAHTLHMASGIPVESLPALVEQCMAFRDTFQISVKMLAHHGLVDGTRLRELKGTTGYRQIAFDVFLLAQILRESWAKIEGKTPLQLAELNQAESLADRLTTAVGERDQAAQGTSDTASMRTRAFTLFIKTYNEVRRAVAYLAPSDSDEIAPTVYIGVGKAPSRKRVDVPEEPEPQAPEHATAAPQNGQQTAPHVASPGAANDSPYTA
jgi:hypothetical protein